MHAGDIYKKSFTFPQIAHNDYAVEQFESLGIAEQNLNGDPMNDQAYEAFVKTADDVAQNLKERYKEQWVDPKDDRGVAKKEDTDWREANEWSNKIKWRNATTLRERIKMDNNVRQKIKIRII